MRKLEDDIARVLIPTAKLQARCQELAGQISADYAGLDLLLICVLKGGYIFMSDLSRALSIPHGIDFMAISSWGGTRTQSSGVVRLILDLSINIQDRHVLIVEDIIDTGHTLDYLTKNLRTRKPASLKICTMLDKRANREVEVPVDYVGFEIPDVFVVGYGLEYGELYRNLPYVGVLKPEAYIQDEATGEAAGLPLQNN